MFIQRKSLFPVLLVVALFAAAPRQTMAQVESAVCKQVDHLHAAPGRWTGQWYVLESDNFEIRCEKTAAPAKALAEQAESLRESLASKWLGKPSADRWQPACQIFLYASKRSYVGAVGPGSERTAGSSLVNVDKGQISGRRIDLLGDDAEFLSAALPHELTHVLLRDRFVSTAPPRWADEGMATLADTEAKQGRHRKDLMAALADGTTFHPANLLAMDDYPRADRFGAFYGESVSLTKFLVERATPQQFVDFVERAKQVGYDAALQSCYGINGARELDREWRQSLNPIQLASNSGR